MAQGLGKDSLQCVHKPVEQPPQDEGPGGPVPQATDQEGKEQIPVGSEFTVSAAPQGEVDIALQGPAQGDVPPPPEFRDAFGLVGGAEVEGQVDVKEFPQAHGHIGIAAEIEVHLEGVGKGGGPGGAEAQRLGCKARIGKEGQSVRYHSLFE